MAAPRTVLITGCSTGIGRATALRLDARGWNVYAGVRKEDDAERLQADGSSRLRPIILDVSDQASIDAATKVVAETAGGGLDGLVNNAGVTVQGPLEYLSLDNLRWQLEVNITGQVAVTQALLPQLRAATGRIVFVGSVAGRGPSVPFLAPYNGSKKALEAVAESLRHELDPWGLSVSIVEPGSVATEIWQKGDSTFDDLVAGLPPEGRDRYEVALARARKIARVVGKRGISADKVAAKIEHALASDRPRFRYLIGKDAYVQAYLGNMTPVGLRSRSFAKLLHQGRRR